MFEPHPPVAPPAGAPARLLRRLIDRYRRARDRRMAQRELRRFGPELLADLGIERDQIPAVAAGLVARTPEERMTAPAAATPRRRAEVHTLAPSRRRPAVLPTAGPDCCAA